MQQLVSIVTLISLPHYSILRETILPFPINKDDNNFHFITAVVVLFKLLFQHFPVGTKEYHENLVRIVGLRTEIRTRDLPNTKACWQLFCDVWCSKWLKTKWSVSFICLYNNDTISVTQLADAQFCCIFTLRTSSTCCCWHSYYAKKLYGICKQKHTPVNRSDGTSCFRLSSLNTTKPQ